MQGEKERKNKIVVFFFVVVPDISQRDLPLFYERVDLLEVGKHRCKKKKVSKSKVALQERKKKDAAGKPN